MLKRYLYLSYYHMNLLYLINHQKYYLEMLERLKC